uniref:Uncharacterized protein n=1 Tax=Rhizophora mucronata TaxID=61149 RepID=A0A2P2KUP8_RHIMU
MHMQWEIMIEQTNSWTRDTSFIKRLRRQMRNQPKKFLKSTMYKHRMNYRLMCMSLMLSLLYAY